MLKPTHLQLLHIDETAMTTDSVQMDLNSISIILNNLNALVYISDMQTYEMIFMNRYGEEHWGEWRGKRCWSVLQSGQTSPCTFCTNHRLLKADGSPAGLYAWEFQNTVTGQWFECRDEAIPWVDGRLVRMEMAFDITARKTMEADLKAAQERAERLAHEDVLTGIRNRRAFFIDADNLVKQAKRYERPLTAVMIDVDDFKKVNDRYGHATGDEVLCRVTRSINDNLREVDIFGRIGGEEFALLLPETTLAEAQILCERIRLIIENISIENEKGVLRVSCSFGLADNSIADDGIEHTSIEDILLLADKALYRAKQQGRNRVEIHS